MSNIEVYNGKVVGGLAIPVENMTLLWENPSPTSAFASQTITLSSGDYDYLLVVCKYRTDINWQISQLCEKGAGALVSYVAGGSMIYRSFSYLTDTSYSVGDGYLGNGADNSRCVPLQIYGIKKNGIAKNVSTKASDCYLNNGKSVESSLSDLMYTDGTYEELFQVAGKANGTGTAVNFVVILGKHIPTGKTLTINSVTIGVFRKYDGTSVSNATGSASAISGFTDRLIVTATATVTGDCLYYVHATVNFTIS